MPRKGGFKELRKMGVEKFSLRTLLSNGVSQNERAKELLHFLKTTDLQTTQVSEGESSDVATTVGGRNALNDAFSARKKKKPVIHRSRISQ